MTDSETLTYAYCKNLLVATFIGLLAMADSDAIKSCICRKCIIGVHCVLCNDANHVLVRQVIWVLDQYNVHGNG